MNPEPATDFVARVAACIRAHGLLPSAREGAGPEPVVVGVSGGADSVALVLALQELARSDFAATLTVAHLHHGLRETTADEDQLFVENLAVQIGLPCTVDRADVRAEAERNRLSIEEAARNARRRFLIGAARRAGARKVALGHTADDRAETVLFNILRGTGLEGLAALGPRVPLTLLPSPSMGEGGRRRRPSEGETPLTLPSPTRGEGENRGSPTESPTRQSRFGDGAGRGEEGIEIIRPLIEVSRAEVREFLELRGEPWREDETNLDPHYARNRLRREVLPLLRDAINPKADEALTRLADQASDAADILADALEETWQRIVEELPGEGAVVIDADDFALLRPWLQGAILRRAVEKLGGGLKHMSAERTREAARALLSGSVAGPVELPGNLAATRRRRAIRIERRLST